MLASWSRAGIDTLLPVDELLTFIKAKSKRPKKGKEVVTVVLSGSDDEERDDDEYESV